MLKIIIHMACEYIKSMQSACRADTVGWILSDGQVFQSFGNAYFILETHMLKKTKTSFWCLVKRANSHRFQSFANENENLSKDC